ncbi:adenylate/guanylate cyclase domain-containing protein [Gordonia sp. X0973]|nr:adenylate/guanylate cyclase domain-containing protein [Gordonia sp. X0973]
MSCLVDHRASRPFNQTEVRRQRLVSRASYGAAAVSFGFSIVGAITGVPLSITIVSGLGGLCFTLVPLLGRVGPLASAICFVLVATAVVCGLTVLVGTSGGLLFYFFVMAAATPMIVGTERLSLPIAMVGICVASVCILHFTVAADTGRAPDWMQSGGFVVNAAAAGGLAVYVMSLGMKQIQRAEVALEDQYQRSETLLDNILPRSISERLKDPAHDEIADTYDDASILFADIVGFTAMSSHHSPSTVVHFLNELYLALDTLTDRYGLEKIKTTGDSYMVVSGVPVSRPDHLEVLARYALEMQEVCRRIAGPDGAPAHLRVGLACGPVVAGVVGSTKFFFDVWGDAVNVASRMESTGVADRIQVTDSVRDRLADRFVFEERGVVSVKGKGDQRTWFLLSARDGGRVS